MEKIIINMIEDGCTLILGVDNTEVEVSKRNILKSDEDKLIIINDNNNMATVLFLDTVKYFKFK